jgi:hypothetical protein
MILGVRACIPLSGITSRTRQTHRTTEPGPNPARRRLDRRRPCAGGPGARRRWRRPGRFGRPGGPAGVHRGQGSQPASFQPVHQPRRTRARSARAASARPSGSWPASSSTAAASAASRSGRLPEWVFESMAGTYQAPTRTQAPNPTSGDSFLPPGPTRPRRALGCRVESTGTRPPAQRGRQGRHSRRLRGRRRSAYLSGGTGSRYITGGAIPGAGRSDRRGTAPGPCPATAHRGEQPPRR